MSYDLDLCLGFLLCECDLKKAKWTSNLNGWFVVLDVTSRKCHRKQLIIMNRRGAAFNLLQFFNFLVFFLICELWGLVCVLEGMLALILGTSDGTLFWGFLYMEDEDDVEWWTVCLRLEVEDKCRTTMEIKSFWISIFLFFISIKDCYWELFRNNAWRFKFWWFCLLDFINSNALKLLNKTLDVSASIRTSRWRWWKALVGHWGWPLWISIWSLMCLGFLLGIGKIEYLNIQKLWAITLLWEVTRKIERFIVEIACSHFLYLLQQIHH
jgi:hypothetical protein